MAQQQALAQKENSATLAVRDAVAKIISKDKVESLIVRVKDTMAAFVGRQRELGKQIARLEIKDQKSYDKANELYQSIKGNLDDGLEVRE